jgi:hypothetical protein
MEIVTLILLRSQTLCELKISTENYIGKEDKIHDFLDDSFFTVNPIRSQIV